MLTEWKEFDAEVKAVVDTILAKEEEQQEEDTPMPEWNPVESNDDDNPLVASLLNLLRLINRDLTTTPFYGRLHLIPDAESLKPPKAPDAVLWNPVTKHVTGVVHVHPGRPLPDDADGDDDMHTLVDENEQLYALTGSRPDIDQALADLDASMSALQAKFGILTTFFQYFFVQRVGEQLVVSHTVWESDEEPSVMQTLYALIEKSKSY